MPYKNPEDQKRAARAHYERNKPLYKMRARAHTNAQKEKLKEAAQKAKQDACCADCGESDPIVLGFSRVDRLPGRNRYIANVVSSGMSASSLAREMQKCEVVCANCRARRAHKEREPRQ